MATVLLWAGLLATAGDVPSAWRDGAQQSPTGSSAGGSAGGTAGAAATRATGGVVMNATDLDMPTLINFGLKEPITDAQGIAACSAYCAKHASTCGGWVYVSPAFMPRSRYTGPRCSIKGKGPCETSLNRTGLFAGATGPCAVPPPRPPPSPPPPSPPPPSPPPPSPRPHGRPDPHYSRFHVQALAHAIYDPDGPAFFNSSGDPEGTYHLFAQYNPGWNPRSAAVFGSGAYSAMQWYHWTSKDLLRWQHQPIALAPGAKQDCGGIWSGSMTLVRNETTGMVMPMITYSVPCQKVINYAVAANVSDANLTKWTKVGTLVQRPEVVTNSSRAMMVDPVPSWRGPDGTWRMIAACNTLRACMWKAPTATGPFGFVGGFGNTDTNKTNSFECPDFWGVPQTNTYVLSTMGEGWAVGSYVPNANDSIPDVFTPLHGKNVGLQPDQLYDYGTPGSSAHRTFFDAKHDRQVLWGNTGGGCPGSDWQGVMSFPRVVELDPEDGSRLISFPLPEISDLWTSNASSGSFEVAAGATHRLPARFGGNQLDVTFGFNANASGTFGMRVLAPPGTQATRGVNVTVSTTLGSVFATLGGGAVSPPRTNSPVSRTDFRISGATIDLRVLVDRAMVEIFAEGGRTAATAWLCAPDIEAAVGVEVFNQGPGTLLVNGVVAHTVASVSRLPWEPAFP